MQDQAEQILKKCDAKAVIAINVPHIQSIRFKPRKDPNLRTEGDLAALRCVARQYRNLLSYNEMEAMLLGLPNAADGPK
ncbi:MAG: hypothetical protein H6918_12985 [Sphingomonadaceae bacterium]|nr:hypothetical protein [Sphingomonadaceae bacterium]